MRFQEIFKNFDVSEAVAAKKFFKPAIFVPKFPTAWGKIPEIKRGGFCHPFLQTLKTDP
ncbi:MAG: hypothetical protein GXO20_07985 [Thermodesulfobacteria bacterium]|nr:hypothetical protein [Thermodesulfobacteriota bacterium]